MNDKDKEAFDEWRNSISTRLDIHDAWQAACKYKDKEIMNEVRQTPSGVSVVKFNKELVRKEIEKLQAENKKLREALEYYANYDNWKFEDVAACVIYMDGEPYPSHINGKAIRGFEELRVSGKRAREALKEVENK
jgi:hypothetical protein